MSKSQPGLRLPGEKWKRIPGYPGYRVSNLGRVLSLKRDSPRLLSLNGRSKDGYTTVSMTYPKEQMTYQTHNARPVKIHRLVAKAFVTGEAPGLIVNHIDGDKTNAKATNLEWLTLQENAQHARDAGLMKWSRGEEASNAKLTDAKVLKLRKLYAKGATSGELSERFEITPTHALCIARGTSWGHVGGPIGTRPTTKVNEADIKKMFKLRGKGAKLQDIADKFDLNMPSVSTYLSGKRRPDLHEKFKHLLIDVVDHRKSNNRWA